MFDYVLAESYKGKKQRSHAWLGRGTLVIDITADQFPDVSESVIVTLDSPWHRAWRGKVQHGADYRLYGVEDGAGRVLHDAYRTLIRQIPAG